MASDEPTAGDPYEPRYEQRNGGGASGGGGGTFEYQKRVQGPGTSNRPVSMYSAYSVGSVAGLGQRARSTNSLAPSTKSQMSIASYKSERLDAYNREQQHQKLNKTSFGPGHQYMRYGIIVLIIGLVILAAGLILVILGLSQRILTQDQVEFIGPALIGVGLIICGGAGYLFYQAKIRSNEARGNIRFKASGAHSVSAVNLAYEKEDKNLVSGKMTPAAGRTPLPSTAVTPGIMTPSGTVQRGSAAATYTDPRTPGSVSQIGASSSYPRQMGRATAGGAQPSHFTFGSAAAHAARRQQLPADMPSFAEPGYNSSSRPAQDADSGRYPYEGAAASPAENRQTMPVQQPVTMQLEDDEHQPYPPPPAAAANVPSSYHPAPADPNQSIGTVSTGGGGTTERRFRRREPGTGAGRAAVAHQAADPHGGTPNASGGHESKESEL